jgi:hypothetical protein
MRTLLVVVAMAIGVLTAACGTPTDPTASRSTSQALACQLMPTVRQIRLDVAAFVTAAEGRDESAFAAAGLRADSDGKTVTKAIAAYGPPKDASGVVLMRILSIGLLGTQVQSFANGGLPDQQALAQFVSTMTVMDGSLAMLKDELDAAGLGAC